MATEQTPLPFELAPLPYAADALAPHISLETMAVHYGKHHHKYVDKLNGLVEGTKYAGMTLPEIVRKAHGNANDRAVFNNAAQTWNHDFFWQSMTPKGGGRPTDATLAIRLTNAFGDLDGFKKTFVDAATSQFGSGWAWLVVQPDGSLTVEKTANAENPLIGDATPLITCDVWEHAYYLDYKNKRGDFVTAFLDHLVNWTFAAENLAAVDSEDAGAPRAAVG